MEKLSGLNLNDYHAALKAAPKKLNDVMTAANAAISDINKQAGFTREAYRNGRITNKALSEDVAAYQAQVVATKQAAHEKIEDILHDVKNSEAWSTTANPSALDVPSVEFLVHVKLTDDEYINLANRYTKENLTNYRLLLSQAEAHGVYLVNAVKNHVEELNKALATYSQYVEGNLLDFEKTETAYSESWGAIVAKFAEPLMTCEKKEIITTLSVE